MDDLAQHRKKRLEQLIAGSPYNGDRAAFMKKAELTKGRISQLLDPSEQFGELAAQRLAEKLGLPDKRWFDLGAAGSSPVWPFVLITPEQIQKLTPKHLDMVQKFALDLLEAQSIPIASQPSTSNTEVKGSRKGVILQTEMDRKHSGPSDISSTPVPRAARGG